MNKEQILALQKQLNSEGAGLKEDGIWGPKTQTAYNKSLAPALAANPATADAVKGSSSDSIIAAYLNNDWSNVNDSAGQPFTADEQKAAYEKANAALDPYYKAQQANDTANTQDALASKQADYQKKLADNAVSFQNDKSTLDQNAADQGVLFRVVVSKKKNNSEILTRQIKTISQIVLLTILPELLAIFNTNMEMIKTKQIIFQAILI